MAQFLIIACSSAIGQAITEVLKKAGHSVFITARDNSKINPDAILFQK